MTAEQELSIEKLVYGGDGLARQDGRVVLVPFVLPGERVRAEVRRSKNDLLRGRVTETLEPSAERVTPECPFFLMCGGCQYQHARYEYQLEQKRDILREVLRRIGRIEYDGEIEIVSAEPWEYRNRTQLHIGGGCIGYFEHGSHRLCAIDRCPISSPKLNEIIGRLAAELAGLPRFEATIELFTNESEVQFDLLDPVPPPFRALMRGLATRRPLQYDGFRVSRGSFFQVNRFLTGRLVEAALDGLSGASALDLYAGVGLFTLPLTQSFERVTAVEMSASAFEDLRANAGKADARQETADAHLLTVDQPPDVIVADPPRSGLGKTAVGELLRIGSPRVAIIACDPATLARDLAPLLAGGYSIQKIALVDLFPQTAHFETVVRLRR
jgi:23S rRNA (uracil1939-C5)-methyltransferase